MGEDKDCVMSSLRLSYQDLSPPLKQCFAYCSLYPKSWEIEKNELILLWMAEGYLQSSDSVQQMEDLGNEFVNTLLKKSFFQDEKFDKYGNLVSFKMHKLMHDLALLVAHNDFHLDSDKILNTPLHLWFSLKSNIVHLFRNSLDACRLRTFYLQSEHGTVNTQIVGKLSVILSFESLRVLKLSRSSLKKLPDLISRLHHLRYLDLSWCAILESLPKSIGNLVNLQTLKLTGCERLEFCTEVVTKLINLRHLEIHLCKAFVDMMPAGLGKLSSLQSLSTFNVVVVDDKNKKKVAGKLNELQTLRNLRGNLEINGLDQVRDVMLESQEVNLIDKQFLESLDLNWNRRGKIDDSLQLLENLRPHHHLRRLNVRMYPGEQFSSWLPFIQHLSHISLSGFDNCKCLPPLEELPYLKSLSIGSMRVLEYMWVSSTAATFFPTLERLNIHSCDKFRGWKWKEDDVSSHHLSLPQFLRLSQLMIYGCPKLTCLPPFPNVEEFELCESTLKPLKEALDTSTTPLSMLKLLKIQGRNLEIDSLPSKFQQNLTSLEHLKLVNVDKLEFWFEDCFPSLKKIMISLGNSTILPDKMCDLLSLQHIQIFGCHYLKSLPRGMSRLINLVELKIWDCPLLGRCNCKCFTGEDLHRLIMSRP